jgi:hypothetical protein
MILNAKLATITQPSWLSVQDLEAVFFLSIDP